MVRAFCILLQLYPRDFRRAFGPAMAEAFSQALAELPSSAPLCRAEFFAHEARGLLVSVLREWLAMATAAPFQRQMLFRDPSVMRPPGMTRRDWAARL
jgi:hypothetical protein